MADNLDLTIRKILIDRNMSQADLAKLLGISGAYLSDIMNGKRDGDKAQSHVKKIKQILGIKEEV